MAPNVTSPAAVSESSFGYIGTRSPTEFSDIDEIVWSISSLSSLSASVVNATNRVQSWADSVTSEDDFILVERGASDSSSGGSAGSSSPSLSASSGSEGSVNVEELSRRVSSLYLAPYELPNTPRPSQVLIKSEASPASSAKRSTQTPARDAATPKALQEKAAQKAAKRARRAARRVAMTPEERKAKAEKRAARKARRAAKEAAMTPEEKKARDEARTMKSEKKAVKKVEQLSAAAPKPKQQDSGLGERSVVDDVSEADDQPAPAIYQAAVNYISSFLTDKAQRSSNAKLRLLQALIIELGLCPSAFLPNASLSTPAHFPSVPALPNSIKGATSLLKSHAFLNVRDYLAARGRGLDALRDVMHPSRQALIRDVRKSKARKVPRDIVKDMGLNVLLVTTH